MALPLSKAKNTLEAAEFKLETLLKARENKTICNIYFESNNIIIKDGSQILRSYSTDEAPTLERFHNARNDYFHRLVMGPRGSGKSVACCHEIILTTILSSPCKDGVKRSKWLVGRRTYGELETTTIRTFEYWFGLDVIGYKSTKKPPRAKLSFFDGVSPVEIEIIFMSFDTPDAAKQALSLELTGAYFNEASYISQEVLDKIDGSIGRYPEKAQKIEGGYYWHGILYDSNAFPDYHPFYQKFYIDKPEQHKLFLQPGGLIESERGVFEKNLKAENMKWLPENYYKRMSLGKTWSFIRTQICNQFGTYDAGKPCHPEYDKDLHSCDILPIDFDLPIWMGWDYGGVNACVIAQPRRNGLKVVKEFINTVDGLSSFVIEVKGWLRENCPGVIIEKSIGDPADNYSIETARYSNELVTRLLEVKTFAAKTNNIKARLEAVNTLIDRRNTDSRGIEVSRSGCPVLHAGLSGKYELELKKVGDIALPVEKPKKNDYSHTADCLQYLSLEFLSVEKSHNNKPSEKFMNLISPRPY